ncbi:MAG: spore coat associated protein CotJA [Clostridia bacterium]|nr:spore coat associated protein CotJA [Clostridia bacterium]MBQ4631272.1 spore coat associated protein CotJA [Clostridia bacterium]
MKKIPFMPENPHLAFAYVPFQEFKNLYSTDKALWRGTIFKELDIPFETYKDNPIMNPFIKL